MSAEFEPLSPKDAETGGVANHSPHEGSGVREPRRTVDLPAVALFGDGSTVSVTVVNLSYNGCKIASSEALAPGMQLILSVLGLGKMNAYVRWCSDGYAGLSFRPDPKAAPAKTPRQHERTKLKATILLRRSGRRNFQVQALDVSASGCRVEFVDRPIVGERQWVKFDGLDAIEAEVSWLEGSSAGLEFIRPVHPAVFELLLAKLK
jgi:hypothetical protein